MAKVTDFVKLEAGLMDSTIMGTEGDPDNQDGMAKT